MIRWVLFGVFVLLFYAGICFYLGKRLFDLSNHFFPAVKVFVFWLVWFFLCFFLIFAYFSGHSLNFLKIAGSYWIAVFMFMFLLLVFADVTRLFLLLIGKRLPLFQVYSCLTALVITFLLIVFGTIHARSIKTTTYEITLPGSGSGLRIALISDIHIGYAKSEGRMKRAVDKINLAQPDIVCIAGDIFDHNIDAIRDVDAIIRQLLRIKTPFGVYACLGNHDVDRLNNGSVDRVVAILESADIMVLQDEVFAVRENLYIAGRKDISPIGMHTNGTNILASGNVKIFPDGKNFIL